MYPVTKGKSNEKIQRAIFYAPPLAHLPEGAITALYGLRDGEEQGERQPTSAPVALLCSAASQIPVAGVKGVNLKLVVKAVRLRELKEE